MDRVCPRCHGKGKIGKSHYSQGRSFEYEIIKALRDKKWYTYRSYASKGSFDIIAERGNRLLAIQAKKLKKNKDYLPPKDRDGMNSALGMKKYEITYYDMKTKHPKSKILKGEFEIIHIYSDDGIKCRRLIAPDTWEIYYLD